MSKQLHEKLAVIQKTLKAPKGQWNNFGKYKYRSCEDIVEATKQVLPVNHTIALYDELVLVGTRYYIKATAVLSNGTNEIKVTAFAREPENKKGR